MVMAGYKQTELGVIPNDWRTDKIGNLALITTGSRNTQDKKDNGEFPFFVRSQTIEKIDSYSFDGEAILTAGDGVGTGKVFHYIDGKFDFHQRVYKISNFKSDLDGYFFFKYFSSHFYDRIMSMTAKSSVDSVRMEMIADMLVPLPKPEEQRAIADALYDVDALIAALDKLIAKKRAVKTAVMQQLLTGKKRLPGFGNGRGYKQTEIGVIPEDWEVVPVGDIGVFANGKPFESFVSKNGPFYLITLDSIDIDGNLKADHKRIDFYDNSLKKDDIVIILSDLAHGNLLGMCDLVPANERYVLNQRVGRLRVFEGHSPLYIRLQINRNQNFFKTRGQGTSQKHIYKRDVAALKIPMPDLKEQKSIAAVLFDMDAEITALETRRAKTQAIKQGMMQELLTGRTRLL